MAANGESGAQQPLLDQAWEDIDHIEEAVTECCNVQALLSEHPHDVVRYLQSHGLARTAEFSAPDGLVFAAFAREPIITLGSSGRRIDYEGEWRRALEQQAGRSAKECGWTTEVDVEAFVVTIRNVADPDKDGLLQPLLKRWQGRACTYAIFALPAVQAVINWKWHAFARRLLLAELACYLCWAGAFYAWTILFQDEDLSLSLPELLRTPRGKAELVAHVVALAAMCPFLLLEAGTLLAYRLRWLDAWNTLDLLTYAIQITITIMHLTRWRLESQWLTVLPAVQCILLVFRLQYLSQAFRPTKFNYLDMVSEVLRELRWYLLFLLLVMYGFGCAFHIVFRRDQEATEEYDTFLHSFLSMFEHQYGDIELKPLYKTKSPVAATALGVAYTLVMGLVLINLLIGIVINCLDRVTEHQDMKLMLSKARIIDELEATMPRWLERRNPQWYPPYIHMLRINPNKLDQVELDALWSRFGEDSPPITQAGGQAEEQGPQFAEPGGQGPQGQAQQGGAGGQGVEGGEGGAGSGLDQRLDVLQRQLESQGRMLERLCRRMGDPDVAEE